MTDPRVYKIDYRDSDVLQWSLTDYGADYTLDCTHRQVYFSAHGDGSLTEIRPEFDDQPAVVPG